MLNVRMGLQLEMNLFKSILSLISILVCFLQSFILSYIYTKYIYVIDVCRKYAGILYSDIENRFKPKTMQFTLINYLSFNLFIGIMTFIVSI